RSMSLDIREGIAPARPRPPAGRQAPFRGRDEALSSPVRPHRRPRSAPIPTRDATAMMRTPRPGSRWPAPLLGLALLVGPATLAHGRQADAPADAPAAPIPPGLPAELAARLAAAGPS